MNAVSIRAGSNVSAIVNQQSRGCALRQRNRSPRQFEQHSCRQTLLSQLN
jgi:hypothetical protein